MRLAQDLKEIAGKIVAVLTGDGISEKHVLEALAEKYDGKGKVLFFPRLTISLMPGSGLNALKAVKIYVEKYGVMHSLFLVDREKFREKENVGEKVEEALRSFGINVRNIESFQKHGRHSQFVKISVGKHEATLYVVVFGERKSIQEDIVKLMKIELGTKTDPNKRAIRTELRKLGLDEYSLLKKAKDKSLRIAFPGLDFALKKIDA